MMSSCWDISPSKRPFFKEMNSSISIYNGCVGDYVEVGLNPFTESRGAKKIVVVEEKDGFYVETLGVEVKAPVDAKKSEDTYDHLAEKPPECM